ncbi:MAG: hypothetical protein U0232_27380 [Thermomicrobiales bacterium]
MQRLRFAPKPVVAAPFGQTLGLGVEICLASAGICAEGETYMGLVEIGVGLIPGGGGCKELVRRIISPAMRVPGTDSTPHLRRVFDVIGQAKVSASAAEARVLGFLAESDRIIFGKDRQIAEAKRFALDLADAGYHPPTRGANCYATGLPGKATIMAGVHQFKVGGFISDYDAQLAGVLAHVICAGDLSAPQWGWTRGVHAGSGARGVHEAADAAEDPGADHAHVADGETVAELEKYEVRTTKYKVSRDTFVARA